MKVFVTGACGQLGFDVITELVKRGHAAVGSDIKDECDAPCEYVRLDITAVDDVRRVIESVKPDAVVHCAAWTAVDAAEDAENRPTVRAINADGTRNIASACRDVGCKMIYISTDYVFGGEGDTPWDPDCEDFAPLNYYGKTKLDGEFAVRENLTKFFIVRTSWVFGRHGGNFVRTMLRLSETHDELRVVNDQIGTPTYTPDLARLLVDMCASDKYGVYNASNEGGCISWAQFAEEIFRQAGKNTKVVPVTTAEYGVSKAKRPYNSRLDKSKLAANGFALLEDYRDALADMLRSM